ncbi:Alpha-amylase 1-like 2 [Homarus americanus]|uniref:Alpha-amylase 1-like 2 n=1 Tax=Homarus americanus TaxID=6706 RepID=A0A8J5J8F8_HOMAM|nr:Alpha-amylase 1-like 2 [Homarus americanus]
MLVNESVHYSKGGEAVTSQEYVGNGRVTEFRYGKFLGEAFRGHNQLKWLVNFGEDWGMLDRGNVLVFIDNHDNQRGSGGGGDMILTFRDSKLYKVKGKT